MKTQNEKAQSNNEEERDEKIKSRIKTLPELWRDEVNISIVLRKKNILHTDSDLIFFIWLFICHKCSISKINE